MRRYKNKHGRYLEATEYGKGGCSGKIVILEGQKLSGWRGFNMELHMLINRVTEIINGNDTGKQKEKGPIESSMKALTTSEKSYTNSLRAPAWPNLSKPIIGMPQITQKDGGKILKNMGISGLRVNNLKKEEKKRYMENFLGFIDFRNSGRDVDFNATLKLMIYCSEDGKRKVT